MVRYLSVAAALALGLLAKPMLVTWPLVFLLLDYWPLRRKLGVGIFLEKVPLFVLVAAFATAAFLGQQSGGAAFSLEDVPLSHRIARAAELYVVYLGKTFWPVHLAANYPEPAMESYGPALAAAALLVLLTAGALWGARHAQRWLAVGWLWYLITLAPVIGLVRVGTVVMADRFVYLPQIGLCMALAWAADRATKRSPGLRRALTVASLLVVVVLSACARRQASYWKDSVTLWTRSLACTTGTWIAHNNLGIALDLSGRHREAIEHFRKGVQIRPWFAQAHANLGVALDGDGQSEMAVAEYREALRLDPGYVDASIHLAATLVRGGRFDDGAAGSQGAEANAQLCRGPQQSGNHPWPPRTVRRGDPTLPGGP